MFTSTRTPEPRKLLSAALLMIALALAGCGSDETSNAETSDQPAATNETEPDAVNQSDGGSESETASPEPVEQATAFWEAVATDDRETALGFVDPASDSNEWIFGRAGTLSGQLEWYEAVGMSWELEGCEAGGPATVDCRATARNRWSDALGVDPVTGTFTVWFGDEGILLIDEQKDSFVSQWGPKVFVVFARWVDENHPEDARIMFSDLDVNPEILGLYATNTERFVEAQQSP